jgi:hypothetical protein
MIGANRIVLGNGIVHVVGDAKASPETEKDVRRRLVREALQALQSGEKEK